MLAYELAIDEQVLAYVLTKPSEPLPRSFGIGLNEQCHDFLPFRVSRSSQMMDACVRLDRFAGTKRGAESANRGQDCFNEAAIR